MDARHGEPLLGAHDPSLYADNAEKIVAHQLLWRSECEFMHERESVCVCVFCRNGEKERLREKRREEGRERLETERKRDAETERERRGEKQM